MAQDEYGKPTGPAAPPPLGGALTPPTPAGPGTPRGSGGMVWFGVALLVLGLFLVARMAVPGFGLGGFWPFTLVGLILAFSGIRQMLTSGRDREPRLKRVFDGLVTIAFGVIFLSLSVGALGWGIWLQLLQLWPVLLIAIGLDIIGKGAGIALLRVLSSIVVLAGLLYAVLLMPVSRPVWAFGFGATSEPFEFSHSREALVDSGEVSVRGAVGDLSVSAGTALAAAAGRSPFGEPGFEVVQDGDTAEVAIDMGNRSSMWWSGGESSLDVELSRDVTWDLSVDSGVSRLDADLSGLRLSGLIVKAGVSDATITLGEDMGGTVPVRLEAGVSHLRIRIPRGIAVRIEADAGISTKSIDSELLASDDSWKTKDFESARDRYDIELKSGVSTIEVELY